MISISDAKTYYDEQLANAVEQLTEARASECPDLVRVNQSHHMVQYFERARALVDLAICKKSIR